MISNVIAAKVCWLLFQVEKCLLSETRHVLPHFLKMSDAGSTHELLPVLCHHLQTYRHDDELCKALLDALHRLIGQCNAKSAAAAPAGTASASMTSDNLLTSRCLALEQLADDIAANVRQVIFRFL